MSTIIREFAPSDLTTALRLWEITEGVGLSEADSIEEIERFLLRNPGLSYVALDRSTIVGAILCGHDGRRGYVHHLVVAESHRRGGIMKCHLFIFIDNDIGMDFWQGIGWTHREELAMMSAWTSQD
jgi:hypothetical protein